MSIELVESRKNIEFDQLEKLKALLRRVSENSPFYKKKFHDCKIDVEAVGTLDDLTYLPFTTKDELRDAYPLGIQSVPDEDVVRVHSSSGTTGKPVIVPYTRNDVNTWAEMMMRCYMMAGITPKDRIQITPGYGLWTAGIGFQAGAERLGAMAIPMGPGNTSKQLQMMVDMKSTVLTSTSSYALLLAEEVERQGLRNKIHLHTGIIGSERWSDKMRHTIESKLGIESFDIYGLTEIYGPGIGLDCRYHDGIHYWADHLLFEIIDPVTGERLPDGELGELVITTLTKEGAPLIRYRTRDLTRLITEPCPCGSPFPRIDRILGRSDDMIKIKGVNIYPGQIEELLHRIPDISSEYQIILTRNEGKDNMLLMVEAEDITHKEALEKTVQKEFKSSIGVHIDVKCVELCKLPRSEKKTKRVIDQREL
ncbi:phenylacetate--CoA ligase family protein [Mahella australiensis]|uniref:Phenylacetate-coenzyme A ligase n=1 Tax=Mahella australiensis (strain DSM 15567 / CIP 107919 / 50-1 BON) TaxID=697281 RepID=F3ZYM0_MAHA5|nr:phenylacetate--CoA ligase [Mahella australiensis]AEE97788.1 phenylacetate-CoA ligase [Mahella australiensis 50-1 BON]